MSYAGVVDRGLGQDYSTGLTVNLSNVGPLPPVSSLPASNSFMTWLDNLPFLNAGSAGGGATSADEAVANASLTPAAASSGTPSTSSGTTMSPTTLSWAYIGGALLIFALVVGKR